MIRSLFSIARNPEERKIKAWSRKVLAITPGNLALYRQALRHSSAVPEDRPDLPDNERLEFLGDAILDAVIGEMLFRIYTDQGEGFLTRMRSKLVSREQLNKLAQAVEIERVMESNVSRGHETSVPGNAMEALIGAIFLDKGFVRTRKIVIGLLEKHFDLKSIEKEDRDNKSRILEWGQQNRHKVVFNLREENGSGRRGKVYVAEVTVDGQLRGTGKGTTKKKAEQEAASMAMGNREPRRGRGRGRSRKRPSGKREGPTSD